jgi:hypothetical protein
MEKVLEGYTSKTWLKRYEGEVGAGRLPPKWLAAAKLSKAIFEAIMKRNIIVHQWKLDITL